MITLPLPPGVNALYKITTRGGYPKMYKSAVGKAWVEEAGYMLRSQWKTPMITEDIGLDIAIYYSGRFDIDSCLKPLLDLFQDVGVIKNDSQVVSLSVIKHKVIKKITRVEIKIL